VKLTKSMRRSLERLDRVPGGKRLAEQLLAAWAEEAEQGREGFEAFHWGIEPERIESTSVAAVGPGELLVELGELVEVVYETEKDELAHWVHPFDAPRPRLAHVADTRGNSKAPSLLITGGRYRVTSRGIVG
jgi:hypothetical protein